MSEDIVRVYQFHDFDEVKKHILILGDLTGDCGACRALGIDPWTASRCPGCGTEFKYVTSRRLETHSGERFKFVRRMRDKRPEWTIVDYTDYTKTQGHKNARDFFG